MNGVRGRTLAEVGEFPLIELIVSRLGSARSDTVVGAGEDDAAVLRLGEGRLQLATIDALVGGVHFRADQLSPEDIGRKAMAINLSDIAAMGGTATHAMVALAAPDDLTVEFALRLVDGLAGEAVRWGVDVVGGNLVRHDSLVVDVAVLGDVDEGSLLLRSGARPGDAVLVTGHLGGAAAGLALLRGDDTDSVPAGSHREEVLARQRTPVPRLGVGPLLGPAGATAAIDVSDGLASDVGHICKRSEVGVRIDAGLLPISAATRAVASALDTDPVVWAVSGGEDYELLFTAPASAADRIAADIRARTGVAVNVIGSVTEDSARLLTGPNGREQPLAGGWRHYG